LLLADNTPTTNYQQPAPSQTFVRTGDAHDN
jgi:hypothetical protein